MALVRGDRLKDGSAIMTFLGYGEDGSLLFHDSLEGDEFARPPGDIYIASLERLPCLQPAMSASSASDQP